MCQSAPGLLLLIKERLFQVGTGVFLLPEHSAPGWERAREHADSCSWVQQRTLGVDSTPDRQERRKGRSDKLFSWRCSLERTSHIKEGKARKRTLRKEKTVTSCYTELILHHQCQRIEEEKVYLQPLLSRGAELHTRQRGALQRAWSSLSWF